MLNRQGTASYLHVARTLGATPAQHSRSFFSRDPARALAALPAGFVLGGDVTGTGVPIWGETTIPAFSSHLSEGGEGGIDRERHWRPAGWR